MKIGAKYGVVSGFTGESSIVAQCSECSPVEDCDCHCTDDDDLV